MIHAGPARKYKAGESPVLGSLRINPCRSFCRTFLHCLTVFNLCVCISLWGFLSLYQLPAVFFSRQCGFLSEPFPPVLAACVSVLLQFSSQQSQLKLAHSSNPQILIVVNMDPIPTNHMLPNLISSHLAIIFSSQIQCVTTECTS